MNAFRHRSRSRYSRVIQLALFVVGAAGTLPAQDTLRYERSSFMIPMRDGVNLSTIVYAPVNAAAAVPFLILRTPYNAARIATPKNMGLLAGLARDGYIFVYQDIRGRYRSEGTFEMMRKMRDRTKPGTTDESTDAFDTIDWLLKNIAANNGAAGVLGVSYLGWTTMMATIDPHPALKAVSEQATMGDVYLGDDFHHNGVLRLSYTFEYSYSLEAAKGDTSFAIPNYDTYDFYLRLGSPANVDRKYFHGKIPTWNAVMSHPSYDAYWQGQATASRTQTPTVPNLHVAGYWDQEDYYGPLKAYETLEKHDTKKWNHIVLGPWNHGGWQRGEGDRLGAIKFDSATSRTLTEIVLPKWFGYYLKGEGDGRFPEALAFQTGSNRWKSYTAWPPVTSVEKRNLYFGPDGSLSFEAPKQKTGADEYLSDPATPVPYRPRPVEQTYGTNSRWRTWLVEDQRFVHNRPDVVSWTTGALEQNTTVTGDVLVKLFASTTGSDADWVAKLIDVYPATDSTDLKMSGYQLMVASEIFRGSLHRSYEKPEALKPNTPTEFSIDLHHINHVFRKGHAIMVQVQSTWFPLYERNPQKFLPNPRLAREADYTKATHRVYRNTQFPSHVVLPVVTGESDFTANDLAAEERAFAAAAKDSGIRSSFLRFLADESIVFRPQPTDGKALYTGYPVSRALLSWYPTRVELAGYGDMGFSSGPWEFRRTPSDTPLAIGHYVTIWKKERDGIWRVKIDGGIPYQKQLRRDEGERFVNRPVLGARAPRDERQAMEDDAEAAFASLSATKGWLSAFNSFAADNVRVYRNGAFPAEGKDASAGLVASEHKPARLITKTGEVSAGGDFGYTYGIAVGASQDTSAFLHVWRRDRTWKLAVDVAIPYAE